MRAVPARACWLGGVFQRGNLSFLISDFAPDLLWMVTACPGRRVPVPSRCGEIVQLTLLLGPSAAIFGRDGTHFLFSSRDSALPHPRVMLWFPGGLVTRIPSCHSDGVLLCFAQSWSLFVEWRVA